jgi:single-strand DNA-binding protein
MAGSYNRIILVGNLTRDPEIRYVGSGAAVTKFTLAVNRRSKEKEETDFIDIVAWEKLAETCNTYLAKGMSVLVEGRLSIRSYDDKDGTRRKSTEVVCNIMQMLDRKQDGRSGNGSYNGSNNESSRSAQRGNDGFDDSVLEDEIPL